MSLSATLSVRNIRGESPSGCLVDSTCRKDPGRVTPGNRLAVSVGNSPWVPSLRTNHFKYDSQPDLKQFRTETTTVNTHNGFKNECPWCI